MASAFDFEFIEHPKEPIKFFLLPETSFKLTAQQKAEFQADPYGVCNDPRSLQRYLTAITQHVYSHETFADFKKRNKAQQHSEEYWAKVYKDAFKESLISRLTIHRSFSDHAEYIILNNVSKAPLRNHYVGKAYKKGVPKHLFTRREDKIIVVSSPPMSGAYGIRPKKNSRLYILDIDIPKELKELEKDTKERRKKVSAYLEKSINMLSKKLKTNLRNTIAQYSASGGIHLFLLLPDGVDPKSLPGSNLRPYKKLHEDLGFVLDGDVRSSASHGYVVGTGSEIVDDGDGLLEKYTFASLDNPDFKKFLLGRKQSLLTISPAGVKWLQEVREAYETDKEARRIHVSLRGEDQAKYANIVADLLDDSSQALEKYKRLTQTLPAQDVANILLQAAELNTFNTELTYENFINKSNIFSAKTGAEIIEDRKSLLYSRVRSRAHLSFHSRRAYVYRALSCCYDFKQILDICKEFGINRDTYLNREISTKDMHIDYDRFVATHGESNNHSGFCSAVHPTIAMQDTEEKREWFAQATTAHPDLNVDGLRALRRSYTRLAGMRKRKQFFKSRKAVALDLIRLGNLIFMKNSRFSQVRRDAFTLMATYFGPLMNMGAEFIIVNRDFLQKEYEWSESRVASALKFLRSKKIIAIAVRQTTGLAPLYRVSPKAIHKPLTTVLRDTWGASKLVARRGNGAYHVGSVFDFVSGSFIRPDGTSYSNDFTKEYAIDLQEILKRFDFNFSYNFTSHAFKYAARPIANYLRVKETNAYSFQHALDFKITEVKKFEALLETHGRTSIQPFVEFPHAMAQSELRAREVENKPHAYGGNLGIMSAVKSGASPPDSA